MKKFYLIISFVLLVSLLSSLRASAYYEDEDGNKYYGWDIAATEENKSAFVFGEDGYVSGIYAAEGDTANQRVNMYALRNLQLSKDEEYSVEATFIPDAETDLSVERAYGIVAWYLDSDNYLIYWMQQKTGGDWSGQFYGRVDGIIRKYVTNYQQVSEEDYWHSGEYNDMWWDNNKYAHPAIFNTREALIDTTITIKIVSKIETVVIGGVSWTGRSFELHQIIDGVDFVPSTYYVQGVQEKGDGFVTGLYSEAFNFEVKDFNVTSETDFAAGVVTEIEKLGTVESSDDITNVNNVRAAYEGLLGLQANVDSASLTKLVDTEKAAAAYVDSLIDKLDNTKSTFVEDVNAVYELYISLPSYILTHVKNTAELTEAVNESKTWTDPNEDKPDVEEPNEEQPKAEDKGFFESTGFIAIVVGLAALSGVGAFILIKKKH